MMLILLFSFFTFSKGDEFVADCRVFFRGTRILNIIDSTLESACNDFVSVCSPFHKGLTPFLLGNGTTDVFECREHFETWKDCNSTNSTYSSFKCILLDEECVPGENTFHDCQYQCEFLDTHTGNSADVTAICRKLETINIIANLLVIVILFCFILVLIQQASAYIMQYMFKNERQPTDYLEFVASETKKKD